MAEQPERQRIRPTVEGRAQLLAAIEAVGPPHAIDPGALGEYAELLAERRRGEAEAQFPEVVAHLASGCPGCAVDLRELIALLVEPEQPVPSRPSPASPHTSDAGSGAVDAGRPARTTDSPADGASGPAMAPTADEEVGVPGAPWDRVGHLYDTGFHAADLPDPRAAEAEAARRQRLRRVRDWLLVAAAVSILLIGLSLIGLAYQARNETGPARLGLTPLPAMAPSTGPSAGRTAPNGMDCPGSHPIKGNRDSMIYHLPEGGFYQQTRPEDCFSSPADAEAAGYRRSMR